MSRLSELQGKAQKFKIGNVELELKPLTVDELELFSADENAPLEKQMECAKKMISAVLKKSIPDATEDEIKGISLEYSNDLMGAISKLHKLEESGVPQRIKDAIKARQDKAKSIRQG
jgi:hypothetical protein